MLCHVLICFPAFMIICRSYNIQTRNVLQNLYSPDEESEANPVRITKDTINNQENLSPEIGANFVNKFFESEDNQQRQRRTFRAPEEKSSSNEEADYDEKETPEDALRHDKDFQTEQMTAKNVTNSSKIRYKEIEYPEESNETEEICCDEDEENKKKVQTPLTKTYHTNMDGKLGNSDLFEMKLYETLPEIENLGVISEEEKPLVPTLYASSFKNKKEIQTPDLYDYIGLLPKGTRLVPAPAVRFKVVPSESTNRRKRKDRPLSRYIPRYGNYP